MTMTSNDDRDANDEGHDQDEDDEDEDDNGEAEYTRSSRCKTGSVRNVSRHIIPSWTCLKAKLVNHQLEICQRGLDLLTWIFHPHICVFRHGTINPIHFYGTINPMAVVSLNKL